MRSINCHIIIAVLALAFSSTVICAEDIMYWGNFDPISLQSIDSQGQIRQSSATITLFTNGNAQITANNTATAQLSYATDTLVTKYKLSFDGDGSSATGGNDTSYETYDSFLSTPAAITYVVSDDTVQVTLYVQASNRNDEVADSGTYNATQTLTVSWVGP